MEIINAISDALWSYLMIGMLLIWAVWFTVKTQGVQFRMIGEMFRLLAKSGSKYDDTRRDDAPAHGKVSSFQAFALSIASRVGTGNLAGVATAIAIGGPGAVMWMWIIALLGSANAFIESTLAQLFKVKDKDSYRGGPAYYILYGTGKRWWAIIFGVLITVTFGLAFNSVQSNTIAQSLETFGFSDALVGVILTVMTFLVITGGITRISRFSQIVVPVMAIAYLLLAIVIVFINIGQFPHVIRLIIDSAFDFKAGLGGGLGATIMMGVKRGLFSNEAGEGSTPNAAATASVTHPVKQGLIQTLGVFTDTLVICTCTAFIILLGGESDANGIALTQEALDRELGQGLGTIFVAVAVFFFAFTSIVANYYYGETNLRFITSRVWAVKTYRVLVCAMVMIGAVSTLDLVWVLADITMGLMTLCNLIAIMVLGKYALRLLDDYRHQLRAGQDPVYHASTIPEIADKTPCWK